MFSDAFAASKVGRLILRLLGSVMESRLRYRFFGPLTILRGADIRPGQTILEVGCGTGFFTVPAAEVIGAEGCLVAMDVLAAAVEEVSRKVRSANLTNVHLVRSTVLTTGLGAESFDAVLLFGVIPAPMLPMRGLLSELRRVLKPEGTLAVWPPIPGLLPQAIVRSDLFVYCGKRNGVHNFRRR
jgi:SAM-dependent methyltransferase